MAGNVCKDFGCDTIFGSIDSKCWYIDSGNQSIDDSFGEGCRLKKQSLLIISIIAIGSLFSVAYSASTIISDSGITTSNLTVTGTCIGCGTSSHTHTVLTSETAGTVVLEVDGLTSASVFMNSTAAYDGDVKLQIQNNDNSWSDISFMEITGISQQKLMIDGQVDAGTVMPTSSTNNKYPFNLREVIVTQSTMGSAFLRIDGA